MIKSQTFHKVGSVILSDEAIDTLRELQANNNEQINHYKQSIAEAICFLVEAHDLLDGRHKKAIMLHAKNLNAIRDDLKYLSNTE